MRALLLLPALIIFLLPIIAAVFRAATRRGGAGGDDGDDGDEDERDEDSEDDRERGGTTRVVTMILIDGKPRDRDSRKDRRSKR